MRTRQPVSQYMTSSLSIQFSNSDCCFYEFCGNRSPRCRWSTLRPPLERGGEALLDRDWPLRWAGTWAKTARQPSPRGARGLELSTPMAAQPYCPSLRGAHAKDSLRLVRHLDRALLRLVARLLRNMEGPHPILHFAAD